MSDRKYRIVAMEINYMLLDLL